MTRSLHYLHSPLNSVHYQLSQLQDLKVTLTLNNELDGCFKRTAWKGRDLAGVQAGVSLFEIADDQRLFLNSHFVLQECVVNTESKTLMGNEDRGYILFCLSESPLNLCDDVLHWSWGEFAWQGDIVPEVPSHFRLRYDTLCLKYCPNTEKNHFQLFCSKVLTLI